MSHIAILFLLLVTAADFSDEKLLTGRKGNDIISNLIRDEGYECEVHQAETEDGYFLKVHRMKPKTKPAAPRLGPVFFMHGLMATAADYILTGPEKALPYLLSQIGYDVWLGNSRGNDFSQTHRNLSVNSKEFWDFSWHEIGFYDVPAMLDLMLQESKSKHGYYVGHSQGGTVIGVLLSTRPEYNQKLIQVHLLAPGILMRHLPNPLLRALQDNIEILSSERGSFDFLPSLQPLYIPLAEIFCARDASTIYICESFIHFVCGRNGHGIEMNKRVPGPFFKFISHSASIKQFLHFVQTFQSGVFRQYDHKERNLQVYNSSSPPIYDLTKMIAPVYMYSASYDILVAETDVRNLSSILPNVRKYKNFENYNHCDFNYGKDSRQLLHEDMIKDMNKSMINEF